MRLRDILLINLAAFVVGAAIWLGLGRGVTSQWSGGAVLALTAPLVATALFGVAVEGASRWVNVGPLSLQVSLIVLPAIIVLYARSPDAIGTAGILVAAIALAAQPDRAMAGVLVAGTGAIVLAQRNRLGVLALIGAVIGFGVTMLRPDALPAVPFVTASSTRRSTFTCWREWQSWPDVSSSTGARLQCGRAWPERAVLLRSALAGRR